VLRLAGAADGGDLAAFLVRAVALDPAVLVRLRATGGAGRVTAHARLPFGVPVSRTVGGSVGGSVDPYDVTVAAADLLAALEPLRPGADRSPPAGAVAVELPRRRDAEWRSALPPAGGWTRLDEVPGEVVRSLVRAGAAALRAVPDGAAASVGESLLDHESLTVSGVGGTAAVPLRVLTALARMGFLGDPAEPAAADMVLVSAAPGGWVRLAAAYGSAYLRTAPTLGLRPR
jgi:hypothetical protein